jgi:hypothetical protein
MQAINVPAFGDQKELNRQRVELEKEAADIAASSGTLDTEEQEYRNGPAEDLISGVAESIRDRRIALLAREIKLREKINTFDQACREAILAKSSELSADLDSARQKVEDALVEIGFERPIAGVPTAITPGLIGAHPLVRKTAAQMNEARAKANDRALQQRNTAAISELKATMKRVRDRQLATI